MTDIDRGGEDGFAGRYFGREVVSGEGAAEEDFRHCDMCVGRKESCGLWWAVQQRGTKASPSLPPSLSLAVQGKEGRKEKLWLKIEDKNMCGKQSRHVP